MLTAITLGGMMDTAGAAAAAPIIVDFQKKLQAISGAGKGGYLIVFCSSKLREEYASLVGGGTGEVPLVVDDAFEMVVLSCDLVGKVGPAIRMLGQDYPAWWIKDGVLTCSGGENTPSLDADQRDSVRDYFAKYSADTVFVGTVDTALAMTATWLEAAGSVGKLAATEAPAQVEPADNRWGARVCPVGYFFVPKCTGGGANPPQICQKRGAPTPAAPACPAGVDASSGRPQPKPKSFWAAHQKAILIVGGIVAAGLLTTIVIYSRKKPTAIAGW